MTFPRCVLLGTLLLLVTLLSVENVSAARGRGSGSHSYPSSRGGLSGHGSHSYSSSNNHGYPSSGGLSGNNGGSKYPSSGGSHGYPSSGSHGYPGSHGLSGNNPGNKPGGMSGNTHTTHTTKIVNNYHYSPPSQISYTPVHGRPQSYPVYHGTPPTYVYQYKDSGSKYGTLLAGLALLNLGTIAAGTAYAVSQSGSHGSSSGYKTQPGEVCKFGIKKDNGDYEETRIDCQLITSFIFQAEQEKSQNGRTNTSVVTTTVTNVTMVNTTNGAEPVSVGPMNVTFTMMPNGTLIPINPINATSPEPTPAPAASGGGVSSSVSVTTTTTNTTVTNALDVKGKPIDVTPGMQCYVIRNTPSSQMKKTVPCGLLQTYAEKSLKKNSATRNMPVFTILAVVSAVLLVY